MARVSRSVGGIQAQVMAAAEMALGARTRNTTRADIHKALWEKRTLVKTSAMRGTLYLLPASEFAGYICALRKSRVETVRRIVSRFGITHAETERMNEAVMDALAGGPVTQKELTRHITSVVGKRIKKWMEHAWSIFRPAIVQGLVCYGPDRGNEVTFVRVDKWLPKYKEVPENDAKRRLLRTYLSAFGPATAQDFSKWTGLSMKETRPVLDQLADELVDVDVEGKKQLILREDCDTLENSKLEGQVVRLLAHFDPYMLGHADKSDILEPGDYKRVFREAGWVWPVVLLNGRAIGAWSYTRRTSGISLEIEPFGKLSRDVRKKIEEEVARLGVFLHIQCEAKISGRSK